MPPKTNTFTNPVPQVAVVAPLRLRVLGKIDSGTFAPFALRIVNAISRYAPVATSISLNCAYCVGAFGVTRIRAITLPAESAFVVYVGPVIPVLSSMNA